MGLFSWFFGNQSTNKAVANLPGPGTYSIDIVGESRYQSALEEICGGRTEESHRKVVVATLVH